MPQMGVTLNWGLLLHCFLMLVQTSEKRPAIRVCCKRLSQTRQRDAPRPCFACSSPHGSFPNRTKYSTPLPQSPSALRNCVSWRPYYEVSVSLFLSHKKHLSVETHRGVIRYSSLQGNRLLIIQSHAGRTKRAPGSPMKCREPLWIHFAQWHVTLGMTQSAAQGTVRRALQ